MDGSCFCNFKGVGDDGIGAAEARKSSGFGKTSKFDGYFMGTLDLINASGAIRRADVRFIGSVEQDDGFVFFGVMDPFLERLSVHGSAGWVVWRAKIDEVAMAIWQFRGKVVCCITRKIDDPSISASF